MFMFPQKATPLKIKRQQQKEPIAANPKQSIWSTQTTAYHWIFHKMCILWNMHVTLNA